MNTVSDRFRTVAAGFTAAIEGVPDGAWESPAPCEGWVARDVVDHLTGFIAPLLQGVPGVEVTPSAPAADDPLAAWAHARDQVQALLDDPAVAQQTFTSPLVGQHTVEAAIEQFILGDVLVHTWDLARATGQDETIDETESKRLYDRMSPFADQLAKSGHFAPPTECPDDATYGQKVIALSGRTL